MTPERFRRITDRYPGLTVAVVGDFCLDRYLEIDPDRQETSIETGLPVHNVTRVRAQPGGAGTILNNLVALGVGSILPVGFCGDDGEGYELRRGLSALRGVSLDHFVTTPDRRTFTYCKPLLMHPGKPPEELNRLDSKNWSATPPALEKTLIEHLKRACEAADAVIFLIQVDQPETGVITQGMLSVVAELAACYPDKPMLADSRQSLRDWPLVSFKMNAAELAAMLGRSGEMTPEEAGRACAELAAANGRPVFVSMAEKGIVAAEPGSGPERVPALPLRGPIDIVGAGDSVTANLATALAALASVREAIELAAAASSHVIHQLGTTGTASVDEIDALIFSQG
jgi:rfaE bifunctional protein kinase chain/domain